jgi:hypothetical protein
MPLLLLGCLCLAFSGAVAWTAATGIFRFMRRLAGVIRYR